MSLFKLLLPWSFLPLLLFSHSVVSDSLRPHGLQHASFPVLHCLPEFAQTHVHWVEIPSNHLILCHTLFLLPSVFPSIRFFSSESTLCIRWPKYGDFNLSISPSNEYSGLISFRIDWFDLLAVLGTLKSLMQHHSLRSSILPTLTSLHDYWKSHSFDLPDLCQESDVSAF